MLFAALLFCFLFGCHCIYSPFSIFHGSCNGVLLQLIECIESMKNEVKKKMIASSAANAVPKSPEQLFCEDFMCEECDAISFAMKFANQ